MPVPKRISFPTGNFKPLLVALLAMISVMAVLRYAAHLPALTLNSQKQATQNEVTPQVAGAQTVLNNQNEEFVPSEDVRPAVEPAADIPNAQYTVTTIVDGDTIKATIDGRIRRHPVDMAHVSHYFSHTLLAQT